VEEREPEPVAEPKQEDELVETPLPVDDNPFELDLKEEREAPQKKEQKSSSRRRRKSPRKA
jgi:hypothetical protein